MKTMYSLALATVVLVALSVPVFATETDSLIESSFTNSYVYKTYLKEDNIGISSNDGDVVLSGTVTDASHKIMAQDIVTALPGVKRVDNRIEISPDSPAEYTDMWISTKVKSSLLYHRNVDGMGTEVSVNDGVVTLRGEAASIAQRDLAVQYVQDIGGVKSVNNQMTIAATPRDTRTLNEEIDDASITAQVKGVLLIHSSTSALETTVTTKMGVVTIGGSANNASVKELVTKVVEDIHGVKSVINNMILAEAKQY